MAVRVHTGRVSTFDEHVGWGEIAGDDGAVYGFHCASILDGTRVVPLGATVRFSTIARLGRIEAAHIETV